MKKFYNKINKSFMDDETIGQIALLGIPELIFSIFVLIGTIFKFQGNLDAAILFEWGGILMCFAWIALAPMIYICIEFVHKLINKIKS